MTVCSEFECWEERRARSTQYTMHRVNFTNRFSKIYTEIVLRKLGGRVDWLLLSKTSKRVCSGPGSRVRIVPPESPSPLRQFCHRFVIPIRFESFFEFKQTHMCCHHILRSRWIRLDSLRLD